MSHVIRFYGMVGSVASGETIPVVPTGAYLMAFDPEAHDGRGSARWTTDPLQALTFASAAEATAFWRLQPTSRPLRPDGQPNRPLTVFTVSVEPLPDPGRLAGEGSFTGTIE